MNKCPDCIMEATIIIPKKKSNYIKKCLQEKILSENETIVYTAKFSDGKEIDVKCCGSDDGPAWTEAVLFNGNGAEIGFTEPEDEFLGVWEIGKYIVEVKEGN